MGKEMGTAPHLGILISSAVRLLSSTAISSSFLIQSCVNNATLVKMLFEILPHFSERFFPASEREEIRLHCLQELDRM